jgi:hypothetical protein
MATIPMTGGFTLVPEGTHVFRIYKVDYDQTFGKLVVHLVTAKGITHRENFGLMRKDGSMNEGACNAFSYFAKTALNDFTLAEIDHSDLVGHYIKADVVHTQSESTKEAGKMLTFANTENYSVVDGFEETPTEKALTLGTTPAQPTQAQPTPTAQPTGSVDLKSLLG